MIHHRNLRSGGELHVLKWKVISNMQKCFLINQDYTLVRLMLGTANLQKPRIQPTTPHSINPI
jgi:hypothetical protein